MRDARDRAIKAGAISSKTRIPQLDGEGEGGVSTRVLGKGSPSYHVINWLFVVG